MQDGHEKLPRIVGCASSSSRAGGKKLPKLRPFAGLQGGDSDVPNYFA